MKLPQHPAFPVLSSILLAYLCGDLVCAIAEQQFSLHPQRQLASSAPVIPAGPGNPGELEALLNQHLQNKASTQTTSSNLTQATNSNSAVTPGNSTALPELLGTMEGQGSALAILQMPGNPDTTVIAVGEEYMGLKLMEVGPFQARLRDQRHQDYTISMSLANISPSPTPSALPVAQTTHQNQATSTFAATSKGPYKTSRELRDDIDNKAAWINNILVQPMMREGESIGVKINFRGNDNPFARLGLQSGDVVLALNNKPTRAVENLPDVLMELRNAQTLNFQMERNGQAVPLTINLEP